MGCTSATCLADEAAERGQQTRRETVLLLHGSAGSGALWRPAMTALRPLYRCLAPDLIGYGASKTWPRGAPFNIAAEQRALEPLLSCCAETFHLVGYSYGGVVALQLALAWPQRVRTLALIEPVFFNVLQEPAQRAAFLQFAHIRRDFATALAEGRVEPAMRRFLDFWAEDDAWEKLSPSMREGMLNAAGKIVLDWEAAFAFAPERERLAPLGPRTLLLRGDQSPAAMIELVEALGAAMPGSSLQVVTGASHLLPVTHAIDVTQALLVHLHADAERRQR